MANPAKRTHCECGAALVGGECPLCESAKFRRPGWRTTQNTAAIRKAIAAEARIGIAPKDSKAPLSRFAEIMGASTPQDIARRRLP